MASKSKRIIYNASINLTFLTENEALPVPSNKIAYLYIDYSYEVNVLPVIYLSLLVNDDMFKKIIDNKNTGSFTLDIRKFQTQNDASIGKTILKDTFSYIVNTTSENIMKDLTAQNPVGGTDNYRKLLLGLISKTMVNKLRRTFNGVYNNINESTIIALALEGTKPVIEKLSTNIKYDSLLVPPLPSIYKFIKYIFDQDPFYDTEFILFMDFDKTYLLSKNGKKVPAGDGTPDSVLIDIPEITTDDAFFEGMEYTDDHYYLSINPINFSITNNQSMSKNVNNLTIIDIDNNITDLDIDYPDDIKGLEKNKVFARMSNPKLLKNTIELNQIRIHVTKGYIDGFLFNPNKEYNITCYGDNAKYNGNYMLDSKQIIFKPNVENFNMSVSLGLKMVGKLGKPTESKSGKQEYTKVINKAVTSTGKHSTSAALRTQANVRTSL